MSQDKTQHNYTTYRTAWCRLWRFGILNSLKTALQELEIDPHNVVVAEVSDKRKLHNISTNRFCGLHGACSAAAQLSGQRLTVIINTGDGDGYSEGETPSQLSAAMWYFTSLMITKSGSDFGSVPRLPRCTAT